MSRSRDLKRRGPVGLGRTVGEDPRERRNASLQSTSRLAARAVKPLEIGPVTDSTTQRIERLEFTVNELLAKLKLAGLMEVI